MVRSETVCVGLFLTILDSFFSLDDITNKLTECYGVHDRLRIVFEVVCREHTNITSKLGSGAQIVTRNEVEVDARFVGLFDDLFDAFSDGVTQNNQGQESLIVLERADLFIAVNFTLHRLHQGLEILQIHVTV